VSITGHKKLKKLGNVKIGNLKRIGIIKKYPNKMKIIATFANSIKFKIPILTAAI